MKQAHQGKPSSLFLSYSPTVHNTQLADYHLQL